MQVLNGYLESAKKHIEEEVSAGRSEKGRDPYSVQQNIQEQPETQRQLSAVKDRMKDLQLQNSQVFIGLRLALLCTRTHIAKSSEMTTCAREDSRLWHGQCALSSFIGKA